MIDCSGSMATRNSLDVAKREMLASINQLAPDAQFAVIFYNVQTRLLSDPLGRRGLMAATTANKVACSTSSRPSRRSGHRPHAGPARGAKLKPEVIFFLTDAESISNSDIDEILTEVGRTRVQCVEFGYGVPLGNRTPSAVWHQHGRYLPLHRCQHVRQNGWRLLITTSSYSTAPGQSSLSRELSEFLPPLCLGFARRHKTAKHETRQLSVIRYRRSAAAERNFNLTKHFPPADRAWIAPD